MLDREEPLDATLRRSVLPTAFGPIADFAAVDGSPRSLWMLLAEDGRLIRFDAETGASAVMVTTTVPGEPESETPISGHVLARRLHVSKDGAFAAVVNDYGRHGQLLDLRAGGVTLALDGGDYCPETVPFSFAFAEIDGRPLAVHRTAWNRLDVSDPATGQVLTGRGPTSDQEGDQQPPHYLDYFHGGLTVSPGGSRVLDDGWVWHPLGVPATWSLRAWAIENPWESEDGPSRRDLCVRDHYWDHAVAWIDERRVAIAGIGRDDQAMVDGVRIFDVTEMGTPWSAQARVAREITAFPGPAGAFFGDGVRLFSSDASGLSRWDPATGARTGHIPAFQPTRQHRGTGELAQLVDGALVRWLAG